MSLLWRHYNSGTETIKTQQAGVYVCVYSRVCMPACVYVWVSMWLYGLRYFLGAVALSSISVLLSRQLQGSFVPPWRKGVVGTCWGGREWLLPPCPPPKNTLPGALSTSSSVYKGNQTSSGKYLFFPTPDSWQWPLLLYLFYSLMSQCQCSAGVCLV